MTTPQGMLAPCPFCGEAASIAQFGTELRSCLVICTECGCRHESGNVGENSGSSWNTRLSASPAGNGGRDTFQKRVLNWLMECFSMEVCRDGTERNHRFLEEALELVQSLKCTRSEAHQLVDYVFNRPAGDPMQELGGVQVTLAALCFAHDLNMDEAAERELARVWTKIDKIREKQAAKPKHSPLPESLTPAVAPDGAREALEPSAYRLATVQACAQIARSYYETIDNDKAMLRANIQATGDKIADAILAALALPAVVGIEGPTAEDIYACAQSTLIGFRDELTEDQIKFICDQISRKATWRDDGLNEDGSRAIRDDYSKAEATERLI